MGEQHTISTTVDQNSHSAYLSTQKKTIFQKLYPNVYEQTSRSSFFSSWIVLKLRAANYSVIYIFQDNKLNRLLFNREILLFFPQ